MGVRTRPDGALRLVPRHGLDLRIGSPAFRQKEPSRRPCGAAARSGAAGVIRYCRRVTSRQAGAHASTVRAARSTFHAPHLRKRETTDEFGVTTFSHGSPTGFEAVGAYRGVYDQVIETRTTNMILRSIDGKITRYRNGRETSVTTEDTYYAE